MGLDPGEKTSDFLSKLRTFPAEPRGASRLLFSPSLPGMISREKLTAQKAVSSGVPPTRPPVPPRAVFQIQPPPGRRPAEAPGAGHHQALHCLQEPGPWGLAAWRGRVAGQLPVSVALAQRGMMLLPRAGDRHEQDRERNPDIPMSDLLVAHPGRSMQWQRAVTQRTP